MKDGTIRKEKIRLGRELAEKFSWEKTAEDYILIFEKIYKEDSNRL